MNKKSQIFTVLAIVLIILMFVSFEVYSSFRERQAISTRVSSMDSFLDSIEENLERQMYISGFRIIFLAEAEITSSGVYIDVEDFFNEAFFNGTVKGVPNQILDGATYQDLLDSINQKAAKISVDVSMENSSINVTQEDPWDVKFTLASDFVMQDKRELAKWEKQQIISAYIPVEGFEDPMYAVNTHVSRKINKSIYTFSQSDLTNLSLHFSNKLFIANPDAPSFLMRLEGSLDPDINGIEGFVDRNEIQQQGFPIQTKSVVDHIYFSPDNYWDYSNVTGMPSWFLVDSDHKSIYQIP